LTPRAGMGCAKSQPIRLEVSNRKERLYCLRGITLNASTTP
jgi:hypothetical protein